MMMGTTDEVVKALEQGPVFMEDLPEEDHVLNVGQSAGLFNMGNTCYMNSTLQCIHSVLELKASLKNYTNSGRSNDLDQYSHLLTVATRDLFSELDRNGIPVAPLQFLSVLQKIYPQFAQQHKGVYMQQDAEECWTQIMIRCAESGEESSEAESVYALKYYISQEVNHLHEGLKHGLKSELEEASPLLLGTCKSLLPC